MAALLATACGGSAGSARRLLSEIREPETVDRARRNCLIP